MDRIQNAISVAGQDDLKRMDGLTGQEAHSAVYQILVADGLPPSDALKLLSAVFWQGWNRGYERGKKRMTDHG